MGTLGVNISSYGGVHADIVLMSKIQLVMGWLRDGCIRQGWFEGKGHFLRVKLSHRIVTNGTFATRLFSNYLLSVSKTCLMHILFDDSCMCNIAVLLLLLCEVQSFA